VRHAVIAPISEREAQWEVDAHTLRHLTREQGRDDATHAQVDERRAKADGYCAAFRRHRFHALNDVTATSMNALS
jgi:hypothetical protein